MKTTQSQHWTKWLGTGAILLVGVAGCADRNKNGQPDSPATSGQINNAVENAGEAATNVASKAGQAASNAADSFGNAAKNLDDAATITPKVKTALGNSPVLKGSNIDVDTTDQSVTLTGSVKNAAQSKLAEATAKKNAPGYKIVNKIKVSGGASPVKKKS
ncbi:MAG TPA: BON domain-containing protein [Abditibacteriaceae bacterium]